MPPKGSTKGRKKLTKESSSSNPLPNKKVDTSGIADADDEDNDQTVEDGDNDQINQETEPTKSTTNRKQNSSTISSTSTSSQPPQISSNNVIDDKNTPPEDDRVWVQCNTCDKWRALPKTVDPTQLPDIWYCELNIYDSERNNCNVSEP